MLKKMLRNFISEVETKSNPKLPDRLIGSTELTRLLEDWSVSAHRNRCVLLLDDAAHAFSPEQQNEFFEIFRNLRSKIVSAKAAVYPGITSYSPYLHIGHDAELVEVWSHPDDEYYIKTMTGIISKRFPESLQSLLQGKNDLLKYLAFASFGIPRGFLSMLSQVLGIEEATRAPTRRDADSAIRNLADSTYNTFKALSKKLPRYKNLISVGSTLIDSMSATIRKYNKSKSNSRKAVMIGIKKPYETELSRMLQFLEYSGLIRKTDEVSKGEKGIFERYTLHYSLLLKDNSLSLGKTASLSSAITALRSRDAHSFARSRGTVLLGNSFPAKCTLNLPPCPSCSEPRLSEEARFCMKCGAQLRDVSVYEELQRSSIRNLPLTNNKIQGLLDHTEIRTVKDILLDTESSEIRKVPYIGSMWAARIRTAAEEFVSV